MPYKSDAQRRYFHAAEARGEISPKVVNEFDKASKGMKLPEYKADGGEMDSLLDGVGQELIDSIHAKDHGKMLDALRALIAHHDNDSQEEQE